MSNNSHLWSFTRHGSHEIKLTSCVLQSFNETFKIGPWKVSEKFREIYEAFTIDFQFPSIAVTMHHVSFDECLHWIYHLEQTLCSLDKILHSISIVLKQH